MKGVDTCIRERTSNNGQRSRGGEARPCMTHLPQVTARQMLAVLVRAGFEIRRANGAHHYLVQSERSDAAHGSFRCILAIFRCSTCGIFLNKQGYLATPSQTALGVRFSSVRQTFCRITDYLRPCRRAYRTNPTQVATAPIWEVANELRPRQAFFGTRLSRLSSW